MSDQVHFDANLRMRFNPQFHTKHHTDWTTKEERYLIDLYYKVGADQLSLELGRTVGAITVKAVKLRRQGRLKAPPKRTHFQRNEGFL